MCWNGRLSRRSCVHLLGGLKSSGCEVNHGYLLRRAVQKPSKPAPANAFIGAYILPFPGVIIRAAQPTTRRPCPRCQRLHQPAHRHPTVQGGSALRQAVLDRFFARPCWTGGEAPWSSRSFATKQAGAPYAASAAQRAGPRQRRVRRGICGRLRRKLAQRGSRG